MKTKLEPKKASWLNKYKGNIDLDPFFQRGTVWSDNKKQYFMDSLLRGWGTPKIFLWETGKDSYACLDGKQRLTSLFKFMSNGLLLEESYSTGFGGKKCSDLPIAIQDAIDDYIFSVEILTEAENDEVIELYKRLQGGTPLNFGEKLFSMSGNMNDFIKRRLSKKLFFKQRISLPDTRYSHYAVSAQLCLLSIKSGKEDLKLKQLEIFFKDYHNFNAKSPEANKIFDVIKYLEKAFPNKGDSSLRNRANIVSIFNLVADISARGNIVGKEKEIGNFFRAFVKNIQKELNKKPENRDPSLLSYQSAVTQGADKIKSINIRHGVLLKKLEEKNRYFYELLHPTSPQDQFVKIYDKARKKLKIRTVEGFDAWLIKNTTLDDIKCSQARGKVETLAGHIRNSIYHSEHGSVSIKDLKKVTDILKNIKVTTGIKANVKDN